MKKIANLLFVSVVMIVIPVSFSSCDKLKEALHFNVDNNQDIFIDIPPAPAGGNTTVSNIAFNLKSHIDAQNTSGHSIDLSKIQYIKVKALEIDIINGASSTNNFANFMDGGVLISSDASAATQVNATMASFLDNPDTYSTHLVIPVTGAAAGKDFKAYLQGTALNYIYSYTLRRPLTTTLQCRIHIVWDLDIQG